MYLQNILGVQIIIIHTSGLGKDEVLPSQPHIFASIKRWVNTTAITILIIGPQGADHELTKGMGFALLISRVLAPHNALLEPAGDFLPVICFVLSGHATSFINLTPRIPVIVLCDPGLGREVPV